MAPRLPASVPSLAAAGAPLVLVLLLLQSRTTAAVSPNCTTATFCQGVVRTLLKCPVVPTVDTIQLAQYTGKWYEIGVSAQFTFDTFGQQGGQCVNANYTALGAINGSQTIRVLNTALQTTTPQRQAQTLAISQSSQASGAGVRFLCQFLAGEQSLANVLPEIAGDELANSTSADVANATSQAPAGAQLMMAQARRMAGAYAGVVATGAATGPFNTGIPLSVTSLTDLIIVQTSGSNALTQAEEDSILAQTQIISGAIGAADGAARAVFQALAQVQNNSNIISGATIPAGYSVTDVVSNSQSQVASIRAAARALNDSRAAIAAAATAILRIAGNKEPSIAVAAAGILALSQEVGPISLAVSDILAGAQGVQVSLRNITAEAQQARPSVAVGRAVQSPKNAGALSVSFFGAPSPPVPNYNIIRLLGNANTGYDQAIVWSCSADYTSAFLPLNAFFILSRTPTIPQQAIDNALAFGVQQGIVLAADNTFLTVSQDNGLCQPLGPRP